MRTTAPTGVQSANITEIARSLDCFTEVEVAALADAKPSTLEAWRKRGQGPEYILFGNSYLYPRESLHAFLKTRIRKRSAIDPKAVLV